MNLDELRSVQSKERSKDSLQHLRETFYADVADYVADLRERRERAAEQADNPFDDPEVNRLTDEIHTAEEVVEAVYERRVGKVVKRASLAAAGMPADEEGLTSEEQELFAELVETIEANKEAVLDVLAGDDVGDLGRSGGTLADSESTTATPEPGATAGRTSEATADSASADVNAADVMGGEPPSGSSVGGASDGSAANDATGTDDGVTNDAQTDDADGSRPATAEAAAVAESASESATPGVADSDAGGAAGGGSGGESDDTSQTDDPLAGLDERTTIRLTSDVGEIFGVDERTYDLESEDVVTLPEANAEPLVERGAAEKLE